MSKFAPLNRNFAAVATATLVLAGVWLGSAWALSQPYRAYRARILIAEGNAAKASRPQTALGDYHLAAMLDRHSPARRNSADLLISLGRPDDAIQELSQSRQTDDQLKLAQIQFLARQFDQSLNTLRQLDTANPAVLIWQSRSLIELNHPSQAQGPANQAFRLQPGDETAQLLGSIQLIHAQTDKAAKLISSLGTSEARGRLQAALHDNTSLAKFLYTQGLLRSSERVLHDHLDNSEAYLLLAQIKLAAQHPTRGELTDAQTALQQGLAIDPGNLELHRLMQTVYVRVGDSTNAAKEGELINRLQSGKI